MDINATTSSAVVGRCVPPYYQSAAVKTADFSLSSLIVHRSILHPRCNPIYGIIVTATQATYTVPVNVTSLQLLNTYGLTTADLRNRLLCTSNPPQTQVTTLRFQYGLFLPHRCGEFHTILFPFIMLNVEYMGIHHH
eukprot:scaffold9546_cov157-Skeletonema_menzelii.AAC.9